MIIKKSTLIKIIASVFVPLIFMSCDKDKENDKITPVGPTANPLADFLWEPAGEPDFAPGYTNVNALAVNSNDHIFAGTTDGAFLSTNDGNEWRDISDGFTGNVTAVLSLAIDSNGYLFAGTRFDGIFVSEKTTTPE